MSQGQQVFNSGGESKHKTEDLHVQTTILTSFGQINVPMRFRLVEHDPTFTKVADDLAVFQDILCLPRSYGTLVRKVSKNLNCRLDRTSPRRPRWSFPWRKRQDLDLGFRTFITYKLPGSTYNTIELNEANWSDLRHLFDWYKPSEAVFQVDWWFKGERVEGERKEDGMEESFEDSAESWKIDSY
jgi:hypothetical protein